MGAENLQEAVARLNTETGRISWPELERHYARGALLTVSPDSDLVLLAAHMVRDDKQQVSDCLASGSLRKTSDADARDWQARNSELWAVVVAPWVLVQERSTNR